MDSREIIAKDSSTQESLNKKDEKKEAKYLSFVLFNEPPLYCMIRFEKLKSG